MADRVVAKREILAVRDGRAERRFDQLAAEEPMEMRVNGDAVAVTMRTPGADFDLALGFCLTEGVVDDARQVESIRYCAGVDDAGHNTYNVVDVRTRLGAPVPPELRRSLFTTSSCGICGSASLQAVRRRAEPVAGDDLRVDVATLAALPDRLRQAQAVFERTGGLHAAALFDAFGRLQCLREDVGRHNAVDKAIGWAATAGRLPLRGHVLMVSGRIAFEIAQKALVAAIPVVAAVSAPTSLAVALAEDAGMTMVGFLRPGRMNVYAGGERVLLDSRPDEGPARPG